MRWPRRDNEEGASLILITMAMLLLVGIAAVAVDLGVVRNDLRSSQLVADSAVTAGAVQINPITASDAEDACELAWAYALQNLEDEGVPASSPTCATFANACNPAVARNEQGVAAPYTITITHPVPDGDALMAGQALNPNIDGGACQRLGMTIERQRDFRFAPVIGVDSATPTVSAVARIAVKPGEGELVPLLLLEPISCDALIASGQGAVTVDYFMDVPGIIVVDSDASKTNNPNRCGNNQYSINANDNALNWVRALPVPDPMDPNAIEMPSAILSYALSGAPGADPAHSYDPADVTGPINPVVGEPPVTWFRLYPTPIGTTRRITRAPIDWRYNCLSVYPDYPLDLANPGVGFPIDPCPDAAATPSYIVQLRGQYGQPVGTPPVGIGQRWTTSYPCTVDPITWPSLSINETGSWWVDCPGGLIVNNTVVTIDGGDLVFDGDIDVRSFGELRLNPSDSSDHVVYVRDGDLRKGAQTTLRMDRTFVYLHTGVIDLGGGAGADTLRWIAPEGGDFEDLALWAEAAAVFQIGGQAGNTLTGTFFTPFGDPFTLTGQGGQFQTNAQFLTRRLEVKGQGVVRMIPDPDRSTPIPIRGVILIR